MAKHDKRFGVVDAEVKNALSGMEFVKGLVDGTLPLNTMAATLSYDILEVHLDGLLSPECPKTRF